MRLKVNAGVGCRAGELCFGTPLTVGLLLAQRSKAGCAVLEGAKRKNTKEDCLREKLACAEEALAEAERCGIPYSHRILLLLVK
jgi:hypothetical protein